MGYSLEAEACRIWVPRDQKIIVSRDVIFLKKPADRSERDYGDFGLQNDAPRSKNENESETNLQLCPNPANNIGDTAIKSPAQHQTVALCRGRPRRIKTGRHGRPRKQFHLATITSELEAVVDDISETETIEPAVDNVDDINIETTEGQQTEFVAVVEVPLERAFRSPESEEWLQVMGKEATTILKNVTWTIVERPVNKHVIGSRFVLCNKL